MTSERTPSEIDQLIHDVLHSQASDVDRQRLSDWIVASQDNAKAYLRVAMDERAVRANLEREASRSLDELDDSPQATAAGLTLAELARAEAMVDAPLVELIDLRIAWWQEYAKPLIAVAGVAFAALIALAVILLVQDPAPTQLVNQAAPTAQGSAIDRPTRSDVSPVATITAVHNAKWLHQPAEGASAPGSTLRPSTRLYPHDRLTLTAGFAEITTSRGAIAILQAPATIELLGNNNALRLHTGKLVGICETESSKGFVVKTKYADITDLGTEFGIHAHAAGVEATVFAGEVEIETPAGTPRRITPQQTARLRVNGNNRELVIEERIATGFETLREQQLVSITLPRLGTGVGLAQDETDPRYYITAIDGKALPSPLPLRVGPPIAKIESDPLLPAQMLKHYPTDGKLDTTYRIEATLRLPNQFDARREQLVMRFRADNLLLSFAANGQSVPVPKQQTTGFGQHYSMPIDGLLQPGDNAIVFEIQNRGENNPENPVGIQAVWERQARQAD